MSVFFENIIRVTVLSAAFFIVALASREIGSFFARFKLPLITGFIFTGILCGPHFLGLLPREHLGDLHFIDQISLAFIAFAAGAELHLRELRGHIRSIHWVTAGMLAVTFVFGVSAALVFASRLPFMSGMDFSSQFAVSLLVATILATLSPAAAIAVVNEMRAKGPLTQTAMGVTVVADVAVIVVFGVNLSVADALLTGVPVSWGFAGLLAGELTGALLIGVFLGFTFHFLLGSALPHGGKMAGVVLLGAGVFIVSEFLRAYTHRYFEVEVLLEPLLICMIATFGVINFSPHRVELGQLLSEMGPVVYVAFFTLTGASIELDVLARAWLVALILFGVRFLGVWLGAFAGGVAAGDPMRRNRILWMSLISQAGIGLGLARSVGVSFPEWGSAFCALLTGVVILNEMVGPPLFKWAIESAGEAHRRAEAPDFSSVRDCLIFGLEDQSLTLARQLRSHGWNVRIASRKARHMEDIGESDIPIVPIADHSVGSLRMIDMHKAEAVVAMLSDEENLQISQAAYEVFGTKDIVVRLNDRTNIESFMELGARVVDPRTAIVSLLEHFVRSPVATSILMGMEKGHDIVGMEMRNRDFDGAAIRDLNLPFDIHIVSVRRHGSLLISQGYTRLALGDWITVSGREESIAKVTLLFEG